ncbi:Non-structural maintenance of chromosomes element 4 like A [Pseudolycoriella hygida]|uniref:Non-structural maintenance of chromosomes element 4 n=1 Tax=Pseudolycoriella hygida TaxID=35572 RepID=A0A9Q0MRC7_9DIPT|nr:Non-structural maintenance of chromosomes element 4 like A [Pseudolycoriella hygida]
MGTQETRLKSTARRNRYKELLDRGAEIESKAENESAVVSLQKITDVAKCADDLSAQGRFQDRIENTTEVVMDAQVTKMAHELLASVVQTLENTKISDDEFVEAVNRVIGCNKDWDKLAEIAGTISKTFTYSQTLFGTFEENSAIPPKKVKERRVNAQTKNSQQAKPSAVTQQKKQDQQQAKSINELINHISKLYKENNEEPLPYYKLIIDPQNFMRTVQNAFKISFLFGDDAIVIEEDESGYPTVRPAKQGEVGANFGEGTRQLISNLNIKLCALL